MESFYASDMFKDWQVEVADLVEGEPLHRRLHGLEAFFRSGGPAFPPPRWKMAIVTWLGVYPVVLFWSRMLAPQLSFLPSAAVMAITALAAVITLAWVVMPLLTKIFSHWLHGGLRP